MNQPSRPAAGEWDAVLHLLDRQIVDCDGAMVGKVDDVELSYSGDGELRVSGLLVGAAALLPRMGGPRRTANWMWGGWRVLGEKQADRSHPWRIDASLIATLAGEVTLTRPGAGLLIRQRPGTRTHRLQSLLAAEVIRDGKDRGDAVLDVRLEGERSIDLSRLPGGVRNDQVREWLGSARVTGILCGPTGRAGSLLGYDRDPHMGPALLGAAVRWIHRHRWYASWDDCVMTWSTPPVIRVDGEQRGS